MGLLVVYTFHVERNHYRSKIVIFLFGPDYINQLGNAFINGKPLPKEILHKIINLTSAKDFVFVTLAAVYSSVVAVQVSKNSGSIQPSGEGVCTTRVIVPQTAQIIE